MSPPRHELHLLARPLNDGERAVFEFFDRLLPVEWEIYLEPHLNGLRPDIVLLNPGVGIAVFEVKDWNLDSCDYWVEGRPGRDPLIRGRDPSGRRFAKTGREDPFVQASLYRREIARLYCPSLDPKRGIAAITAGVIFPSAADDRVLALFDGAHRQHQPEGARDYWRLVGRTSLESGAFEDVLPSAAFTSSRLMNETVAQELRHWLVEPDVAKDQRDPPRLTAAQLRHVDVRDGPRYRRLKGPAGSGKSVVLAARAESLDAEGKNVLVLTFNLTLPNYLRDLASAFRRARGLGRPERITWMSFHAWCKRQLDSCELREAHTDLWRAYFNDATPLDLKSILEIEIPELVRKALAAASDSEKFDAILIDEGQDWLPEWFEVACKALRPDGEVFFAADDTQDLYDRAPRWTDGVMSGVGFRGDWRRLAENHRLPPQAARLARRFAVQHLDAEPDLLPEIDQVEMDVYPALLRWVQADPETIAEMCIAEIDVLMNQSRNGGASNVASWADLFLVFDRADIGSEVVDVLSDRGIEVLHTFDANRRASRTMKLHFYKGDARVKATTIHSFKGWEARQLVVVVASKGVNARKCVYSGLTRLKRSDRGSYLTILCGDPSLAAAGLEWPDFEDRTPGSS